MMENYGEIRGIRSVIRGRLVFIAAIALIVMLAVLIVADVMLGNTFASRMVEETFSKTEHILRENWAKLEEIEEKFNKAGILEAREVAFLLQHAPEIIEEQDIATLKKVAGLAGSIEINLIDPNGEIFFGTRPEFYGKKIGDMEEFKEYETMIKDHTLELVPEANGMDGDIIIVRFAAWNEDDTYIVQIGMDYETTLSVECEPYYIVNTFARMGFSEYQKVFGCFYPGDYIMGCNDPDLAGKTMTEVGLRALEEGDNRNQHYSAYINGDKYTVYLRAIDETMVGCAIPMNGINGDIFRKGIILAICIVLTVVLMTLVISRCIDIYVTKNIDEINGKLKRAAGGDTDVQVEARNSREFSTLSDYINKIIAAIRDSRERHGDGTGSDKER